MEIKEFKFSLKSEYVLLSLLVLLNILLRVPITSHVVGMDTFYILSISAAISRFGKTGWILHPSSFFGLYPYSYPSAQPFILSGLSQSLNISLEATTLLFCIFLGFLGVLSSFILAEELFNNRVYSILFAFLYSTAPNFIRFTYWSASTRGMFLALLPLLIWLFIRCGNKLKHRYIILSFMLLVLLLATHRIALLLIITVFAYIIALILSNILEKIKYPTPQYINIHIFYLIFFLSCLLFFIQFSGLSLFSVSDYYSGLIFNGKNIIAALGNMSVDYISKLGICLLFLLLGLSKLTQNINKSFGELLILINLLALLPLMGLENYSPLILFPFLMILAIKGILTTFNIYVSYVKWKKGIIILTSLIIISSTVFSIFMIDHFDLNKDSLNDETIDSAKFIKDRSTGTMIANTGDLSSKITALSAVPTIPLGGIYALHAPPNQIAYGFVNPENIIVRPLNLYEIRPSTDEFYALTYAPNAKNEWVNIMQNNYWDAEKALSEYNASLVIETDHQKQYLYWKWRYSRLLTSLHDSGNKIYDNNNESIYSVP